MFLLYHHVCYPLYLLTALNSKINWVQPHKLYQFVTQSNVNAIYNIYVCVCMCVFWSICRRENPSCVRLERLQDTRTEVETWWIVTHRSSETITKKNSETTDTLGSSFNAAQRARTKEKEKEIKRRRRER